MRNGIQIVDVDRHLVEPMAMWPEYLPAQYRDVAPDARPFAPPGDTLGARLERLGDHALLPVPVVVTVGGKPIFRGLTEIGFLDLALRAEPRRSQVAASG